MQVDGERSVDLWRQAATVALGLVVTPAVDGRADLLVERFDPLSGWLFHAAFGACGERRARALSPSGRHRSVVGALAASTWGRAGPLRARAEPRTSTSRSHSRISPPR